MSELVTVTVEWATNTGVPNGLLVLALLTSPSTWSERITNRIGPVLDRFGPGAGSESATTDENR